MLAFLLLTASWVAQEPLELKTKPITTAPGKVGDLLRQWWKEGTAAGNVGDWYDNRDAAHSDLNTVPYPQLQRVVYSPEDVKAMRHWAAARVVRPQVTVGNSSTSAPPTAGGSNPRSYYCSPFGLNLLHQQYLGNNIYIYPEHRDHDPGHNGRGDGFGDLYPTNTPYLIISQGSSGSDQPFMRAIPFTLAAFRPDVKKKLTETGLLMPTLQMIFRSTNKQLKDPKEYLTGLAHPTVFEGSWVDELAMVKKAHDIEIDKLPPLVRLKASDEESFTPGRDYFDPLPEKLADTPGAIARVFRSHQRERRMIVDASASEDLNGHPLAFTWVVLRGDPSRVKIAPMNKAGTLVEIVVGHHERRPIAPGSPMESNRVDIGVFAHNGFHYSSPAFVTFYTLDTESRTYDAKGRIVEIGYGMGETTYHVVDWSKWIETAIAEGPTRKWFNWSPDEIAFLREASGKIAKLQDEATSAKTIEKAALAARQKADDELKTEATDTTKAAKKSADIDLQAAQKKSQAAAKALADFVDGKGERSSPRSLAETKLQRLARRPEFLSELLASEAWSKADAVRKNAVDAASAQFAGLGFDAKTSSAFGLAQLERLHAVALGRIVFHGSLTANYQTNFVDQRLTAPRFWRDVHRHTDAGQLLGWTRHDGMSTREYGVQGLIVEKKDALGRCVAGRVVNYRQEPLKQLGLNNNPLRPLAGEVVVTVEFAGDDDFKGRIVK